MLTKLEANSESGAVLIIAVIIMAVSVVFIAAMNNIIAPMLDSDYDDGLELQVQYLAEAGLAQRLQEVETGDIQLGSSDGWESFGPGEYKTDVSIADGDYLYLSSTARIDDTIETVTARREINTNELYYEDFSEVRPALNLAGEGYTRTDYTESQISDQFTIEAWVKLDDTDIDDKKYILSGYNDILDQVGDFSYSKPYSLYLERQGNRVNLIAGVETWIDNWWWQGDEREYLTIELSDVEKLADNKWVHIAFSGQGQIRFNNLNQFELDLYINGENQKSETISADSNQYLHTNYDDNIEKHIALGGEINPDGTIVADSLLPGQIRDIRIWDEVRSRDEIAENMDNYLSGDEAGLVTYYPVNDPPNESVPGEVMDFADGNNASKEGTVVYSLTKNWTDTEISSLDNLMVEESGILVVNDLFWFYGEQLFDYDEDSLYKIEFRVKQEDNSATGTDYFYLGVEGLRGEDRLVDASGGRGHSEQYYTALMGQELSSEDGWQIFSGYFSGETRDSNEVYATIDNNPPATIIHNPMPLHRQASYFRPVIIANYDWDESDDFGIAKIDYVKIEELEIDMGR